MPLINSLMLALCVLGAIHLAECNDIVIRDIPIKGYSNIVDVVTTGRTYHLSAKTKSERDEWYRTLRYHGLRDTSVVSMHIRHHYR